MNFNGFISYSHAADGRLAPAVQRGLHRLGRPWHRRRALWIFRDQTGLSVTPRLWTSIQTAMDSSEYFVLLASPEAAQSPWVNREIEHWLATKPADRILPVVTDGEWAWDPVRGDFTDDSTAVAAALRGVFAEEPFILDLRWARGSEHLSLQHSRFRDAIAQLAAPMHGVSKDELEGEDVRQHRRAKRLRSGAAVTLVVLALLASAAGMSAVRNAERARAAAAEALRQQGVAESQRSSAERSAEEARRQQELATQLQQLAAQQQVRAAQARAEAEKSERRARDQQELADHATAEARRQQWRAEQAKDRTREQQELAQKAAERAREMQGEAQRQAKIAEEQRRLAHEAGEEAARQQAKADEQQRLAVSRRLLNQAVVTIGEDPQTALQLGAAAQRIYPDTTTRRQLAGVVSSTRYTGTLADVTATAYAPDGVLAAIGTDNRLSLWNVSNPVKPVRLAVLPTRVATDGVLEFSSDGKTLAVVDATYEAVLFDVAVRSRPVRLSTLKHDGDVTTMSFSRDGRLLVTGDGAGDVKVWNTADRRHPRQLAVESRRPYPVMQVALSPNGRLLMVDQGRWTPVFDLTDPARPVSMRSVFSFGFVPMAFSPDGKTLAYSGRVAGTVTLLDMTSMTPAGMAKELNAQAQNLPPGKPALPGTTTPTAPVPPPPLPESPDDADASEEPVRTPPPLPDQPDVPDLPDLPDDEETSEAPVRTPPPLTDQPDDEDTPEAPILPPPTMLDLPEEEEPPPSVSGLSGDATTVEFSSDGSMLAAGDASGTAVVWDLTGSTRPTALATVRARGPITTVAVDPKAGTLVTADSTATATEWTVGLPGAPERLATLGVPDEAPRSTVFNPDGRSLVVAGSDGKARTWNTTNVGRPVPGKDSTLRTEAVRAVVYSPDRRKVATVADESGTLTVADTRRPAAATKLTTLTDELWGTNAMAFSSDGRTLAVVDSNTTLLLWDVANLSRPVLRAKVTGASFGAAVAFSPDGRALATAEEERPVINLWNLAGGSAPARGATITGHSRSVDALTFSPDGRTLASGSSDDATILWGVADRARPHRLATLTGEGRWASRLQFSPDGRTLVTAGAESRATIWDTTVPAEPVRLATVQAGVGATASGVTFRSDGRTLAVTGRRVHEPASVSLWSYSKLNTLRADPAHYACAVTGRGLTADEWARYIPEVKYRRTC
ncbi:TIR domain-containing protein [Actinoplanes sp. URMC 104]|uniref:toll/interleukin-1 receptor domain-containing protein n=1 Tax=Actinoplanes sp. URMC 104 TaxID=3423409 RepID=UPI003F1D3A17